jgi:hypothetical protein
MALGAVGFKIHKAWTIARQFIKRTLSPRLSSETAPNDVTSIIRQSLPLQAVELHLHDQPEETARQIMIATSQIGI